MIQNVESRQLLTTVTGVLDSGRTITEAATLTTNSGTLTVNFSGAMSTTGGATGANSVTNPANWLVTRDGVDVTGTTISTISYSSNSATLAFSSPLSAGTYQVTAKSTINDASNVALTAFTRTFSIASFPAAGSETRVNTTVVQDQTTNTTGLGRSIAMDSTGNYVVVWSSNLQDAGGYGIYAQRYNASGVAQGTEFRVNTTTANNQKDPVVAMDNSGNFVVAWTSTNQDGGGDGVYAQRYNASGVAQGSEFLVNTTTTNGQSQPAIGMNRSSGSFVISWTSFGQDGADNGIYAKRYNSSGAVLTAEFKVNTTTTDSQSLPSVGMDNSGNFVVAWTSFGQDTDDNGVYAQRYDATATAQGSEFRVNTTITDSQSHASVAMDSSGNFVVTWTSQNQEAGLGALGGVYGQRYNASGVAQGSEFHVNSYTTNNQYYSSVDMDGNGNFVVTWTSDGQDNSVGGVYSRRYDFTGAAQGAEFKVNTTTANGQKLSSVAMNSTGDFAVVWTSDLQDSSSGGIYAQRFKANVRPVVSGLETTALSYTEGAAATVVSATAVVSDAGGTNINGATIKIATNYTNGQDALSFANTATISGVWSAATGILTLSGTDTIANYQAALRTVKYANSSNNPSTLARTVTLQVNDGVENSDAASRTINVVGVNNTPVLSGIETAAVAYTENATPVTITSLLTAADVDNANLTGATVTISSNFQLGADVLSFANTASITGTYNASTGVLTLAGTTTVANYQAALRSIKYSNVSNSPTGSARTLSFQVTDGTASSNTVSRNINVTPVADPAVLAGMETTALSYTENGSAITLTSAVTISDLDSTNLTSATVKVATNYQSGADVLSFTNTGTITGTYNASTGTLTLTGTDTLANYQTALRSVTYHNTSNAPSTLARSIQFTVNDGTVLSAPASRTLNITAVNDGPTVTGLETAALTAAENLVVAVTGTIVVTEPDGTNLSGATVQISSNYQNGQDVLSFATLGAITGSWNATTGTMTLSGAATAASYQAALRTVKYQNTSNTPTTTARTLSFVVTDGTLSSTAVTRTLNVTSVNDAPVLAAIETTALAYTENGSAAAITSAVTISDLDHTNLTGATVKIATNFQLNADILAFTNTATITGTYNASTGVLTLAGSDTLANYQTALRSVTYRNSSNAPTTLARAVQFSVTDGTTVSNIVSRSISITAVNDAPVVSAVESTTLTVAENAVPTIISGTVAVTEPDGTNLAGATISISSNFQTTEDVLSFVNTATITGSWNATTGVLTLTGNTTAAAYQAALRTVKYQNTSNTPSNLTRSVQFTVTDGTLSSTAVSRSLTVTAVNDAPVLSAIETTALAYTENAAATAISATIAIADADHTNLTGATIKVATNFQSAADVLSFTNTATITGTYNATSGVLTLTGSDTLANYQAALRAVKYHNSSNAPSTLTRSIQFTVTDGVTVSAAAARSISVTAVNDAPTLAGIETSTLILSENAVATPVSATVTVSELDGGNLTGATISISANYQSGQDVLSFTTLGAITGSWNATTGTMTLTGNATAAAYQAALRTVKYQNSSNTPSTVTRTVQFTVTDGTASSSAVSRALRVTAVNDAPVLSGIETTSVTYSENAAAAAITSSIVVSDVDDAVIFSARVKIGTNYQSGADVLSFTNTATITGTFDVATGTMTLSGADSVANYQAALRAVKYSNTSDNPTVLTRTVLFQVTDVSLNSNVASRNITVIASNDAPTVTSVESSSFIYTKSGPPVAISSSVVVGDVDNVNLASARVKINTNYQSGQDLLSFTNTTSITGSWDAATGTMILSGTATVAQYQAALRSVKYSNTSSTPSFVTRNIVFLVNDGAVNSNVASRNLEIHNVAPILSAVETTALAYTEGAAATAVSSTIAVTDVDGATITGATVSITGNFQTGQDVLSFTNTGAITGTYSSSTGVLTLTGTTTLANYEAALRAVKYNNSSSTPSTLTRTVSFQVTDATLNSNTATRNITVTAVNNAPVLASLEVPALSYTSGSAAANVTSAITVADADSTLLTGATIQIDTNYNSATDVLSFINAGGITGSWNSTTGTLTLSGSATVAAYQAALRTVKFFSSAPAASPTRRLAFTITDGSLNSTTVTRLVTIV